MNMISQNELYESFPLSQVITNSILNVSTFILGTALLLNINTWLGFIYLAFCIGSLLWIMKVRCSNCYYYGKICGLGRGKLCAVIFRKGNPEAFTEREISWKDLLPDFMVLLFPLICGIIVIVRDFSWLIITMILI